MSESDAKSSEERTKEVDDQFRSLMEGLRTTIPGVMVLFAFLLTLPLQPAFAELTAIDRDVFYLAFVASALAAVLLIAPSVHQRLRAPISGLRRRTWSHVMTATRLAIAGTVSFSIAIASVVYLVSSLVFATTVAIVATAVTVLIIYWAWFHLPLVSFGREDETDGEGRRLRDLLR